MPGRKKVKIDLGFGERLAEFRKRAGYSQRAFAKAINTSQRMVAYYESQGGRPPAHLFPVICETLGISLDELLGKQSSKNSSVNRRMLNKLKKIETLPPKQQKMVLDFIDAFAARAH